MMNYYLKWRDDVTGPFSEQDLAEQYRAKKLTRFHQVSLDQKNWLKLTQLRIIADPDYRPDEPRQETSGGAGRRHPTVKIPMSGIGEEDISASQRRPALRAVSSHDQHPASLPAEANAELPTHLTTELLRDPKEYLAFGWLAFFSLFAWVFILGLLVTTFIAGQWTAREMVASLIVGLLILGVIVLAVFLGELFAAAYIKTNALQVGERQIPELYQLMLRFARRLGQRLPTVYVMQESVWNALAIRLAGRRMVVLYSGAVDSLLQKGSLPQLAWLAGHELGHHFAGHLNFWTHTIARLGAWFFWVALWYRRRCELTCDRYGLACSNSLAESQRAVCNMTVGAQLAPSVNIAEAVAQWQRHRSEFFVGYRTLYSTHPHALYRLAQLAQAAQEIGIAN